LKDNRSKPSGTTEASGKARVDDDLDLDLGSL
jgi:hypothetical protein